MKVRLINAYLDKYTNELYERIGAEYEVTDERGKELIAAGKVEEVKTETSEPTKKKKK